MMRKRTAALFSLFLLLAATATWASGARTVDAAMQELLSQLGDTQTEEHEEARKTHLLRNPANWVVVFFTLEGFAGTNDYSCYMAVFEPDFGREAPERGAGTHGSIRAEKYRLVGYATVGGKGWRNVDFANFKVDADTIILQTTEYRDGHPMSTPSKPGRAVFKVQRRQVVEVPAPDQPPASAAVGKPPQAPRVPH
jgi:hypothetical protein